MPIEFPLPFRPTAFGVLSLPKIPILVRGPRREHRLRFIVDTGSEFAVAPRRVADLAGLQWETLPEARIFGVSLALVPARLGRLPIRIGSIELTVRCFFVNNPRTPLLLGRADFLDRFVVTIDQPRRKIMLDPV